MRSKHSIECDSIADTNDVEVDIDDSEHDKNRKVPIDDD